jgi:hypothetical protein
MNFLKILISENINLARDAGKGLASSSATFRNHENGEKTPSLFSQICFCRHYLLTGPPDQPQSGTSVHNQVQHPCTNHVSMVTGIGPVWACTADPAFCWYLMEERNIFIVNSQSKGHRAWFFISVPLTFEFR